MGSTYFGGAAYGGQPLMPAAPHSYVWRPRDRSVDAPVQDLLLDEDVELGIPGNFASVGQVWGAPTATLDTTSKLDGANSILFAGVGEGSAIAEWDADDALTEIYLRLRCFIPASFTFGVSGYCGLLNLRDGSDSDLVMFNIEDWGSVRLTVQTSDALGYTDTGIDLPLDEPFTLQIHVHRHASTGRVRVWLDNDDEDSPDFDTGNADTGAAAFQKAVFGMTYVPEAVGSYYLDTFAAAAAFILPASPGGAWQGIDRDTAVDFAVVSRATSDEWNPTNRQT